MSRGEENRPYRWLARYYDVLFGPFRSPMEEARRRILGRVLLRTESACDLACGTGTTAVAMARTGIRTFAIDNSPDMCRLARQKAKEAAVKVRVLPGDMRDFRLPQAVDLITCEYDAINHVPRKRDLLRVARSAARSLRAGGHFYFDVNNRLAFEQYWKGDHWLERPGVVVVMRNGHARGRDRAWSDVEWFIQEGKLWRRRSERVVEVCWTEEEVRRILTRAGFDRIQTWDAAPFFRRQPRIGPGCRTVYLARRGGG